MLRPVLFATAVVALVAPLRAADSDIAGNWLLTYSPRAITEANYAIIQIEMKDGKPTASVIATPGKGGTAPRVTDFSVDGKTIKFVLGGGPSFEGTVDKDGKVALGSFGTEQVLYRAALTKTDKTEITQSINNRKDTPEQMTETQKLSSAVALAKNQAAREKDKDAKKELLAKADAVQAEANAKVPPLLREVISKHGDTPFALDAANDLIAGGKKYGVTPEEASALLAIIEKQTAQYGSRYSNFALLQTVEALATSKGLEPAAVNAAEKLAKAFTADTPDALRSRVLSAYKTALEKSTVPNKDATLKTVSADLAKVEAKIDAEYHTKVPPFKPTAFAGRKEKTANQVAVMELFTGAQCPPCVAADVAFDALQKSYKPTELILIQYHMHIPGPDPLTNPDTVARWDYYRELFPKEIGGTPSTLFNGKPQAGGGGGMAAAENKYKQYAKIIDPILEQTTDVKVTGKANRTGDKLTISVEVANANADGEETKLRLLVVEENVKYVGGNALRFHHQVVRAMPGGIAGVAIKDKSFKHTATVDLVEVRKNLTSYLDDYAENMRAFPKPDRPMDMKAVKVIALIQNDKTKEIVQAAQFEVSGGPTANAAID